MNRAKRESPRVLVVPSSYFAANRTVGGGERYATEYARALSRLTPTTLALFDTAEKAEHIDELQVRTFSVRSPRDRLIFPMTPTTRRELAHYDVIHLMIFPTPLSDLLLLLARARGQTVVLTDVGGGIPSLSTYLQRLHPRLSLSRLADGLALLSRHSARHFDGWSTPRTLLYGGGRVPPGTPARVGEYALFVGRLLPHKGVLELIEAVGEDTPLHVVGRPYDPEYLAKLRHAGTGKRVTFFLDADDGELHEQYSGARVVLQPSVPVRSGIDDTAELLGLVTLEGMAYGKPVIVTRTASLPELVRDGETGFIVEPGNRAALRNRIELLMNDPELSCRFGRAGREVMEKRFTWGRVAERGLAFYEKLRPGLTRGSGPDERPAVAGAGEVSK